MRYLILVIIPGLLNCAAPQLLSKHQQVPLRGGTPENSKGVTVVLSPIIINENATDSSMDDKKRFQQSLQNTIFNSGVLATIGKGSNPNDVYIIEPTADIEDRGSINWFFSWPAIYPLPMYWPFQIKRGQVVAKVHLKFFRNGEMISEVRNEGFSDYSIIFYGFFKEDPIEQAAAIAINQMLVNLENNLKFSHSKYKRSPPELGREIRTLAILSFETKGSAQQYEEIILEKLRAKITNQHTTRILERSKVNLILDEQEFQQSGCVDDSCRVEVGKILGVTHILTGSMYELNKKIYLITRVIDCENGEIIRYASAEASLEDPALVSKLVDETISEFNF